MKVVILLFSFSFLWHGQAYGQVFKLQDLVKIGLEKSPTFLGAKVDYASSELSARNEKFNYLPKLSLRASHGYGDGTPTKSDDSTTSLLQVNMATPLYQNGKNFIYRKKAYKELDNSEIEFKKAREDLALEILRKYFDYILGQEVLEAQREQLKIVKRQFSLIETQYKQGIKMRVDYLRSKASLERSNLDLINQKNSQKRMKVEIAGLINFDGEFEIATADHTNVSEGDATLGLSKNLTYLTIQNNKKIDQLDYDLSKKDKLPQLNLDLSATYKVDEYLGGASAFSDNDQLDWAGALTLSYSLFDWGKTNRNVKIAKLSQQKKDYGYQGQILKLKERATNLSLKLSEQFNNLKLTKELFNLEETNYKLIEERYRSGTNSYLDLTNSLRDYIRARESYYRNLFSYHKVLAEVYHYEGQLYDKLSSF